MCVLKVPLASCIRYTEAQALHGKALHLLSGHLEPGSYLRDLRSDHHLGLAALQRRQADFCSAHQSLERALADCAVDDLQTCCVRLEAALLKRDLGDKPGAIEDCTAVLGALGRHAGKSKIALELQAMLELAWMYFCDHDCHNAQVWFMAAIALVEGSPMAADDLQYAQIFGGAAAVLFPEDCSQQASEYQARAEDHFKLLPCKMVEGAHMVLLYMATAKLRQGSKTPADKLFCDSLKSHSAVYSQGHPSIAILQRIVEKKLSFASTAK